LLLAMPGGAVATVRAEIEIDAPPERIFDILTDLEAYPEWNPFTPRVESTLRPGDAVHLYVRLRGQRLSRRVEYVSRNERPTHLCWGATIGASFLLRAERCQTLTRIDERRTRFVNEDVLRGWLAPLVMLTFGGPMQRGFEAVASALKERAESR
jgi:uncharacterized protein YndB with AHSA1/START domain